MKWLGIVLSVFVGSSAFNPVAGEDPPKMKYSTPVPEGVETPNRLNTSIGELTSVNGVPDEATTKLIFDQLDFQRATQVYLNTLPIASLSAMETGLTKFGPPNTTVLMFEELMDSRALWLTPNTTSIYMAMWLELGDEPMVIETPPNVLGFIDNAWFKYVGDFGNAGPDRGKGGKFLIIPPGYDGEIPEGYFVLRTTTFGNWMAWRGFQVDGKTEPAVNTTKKIFKVYPLSQKNDPPKLTFLDVSGKYQNTIHRMDYGFWEEVNRTIQDEPIGGLGAEIRGQLASIGIEKGKKFSPDPRMKKILTDASNVGAVTTRALAARPRDPDFLFYPGQSKSWTTPFPGGNYRFLRNGGRLLDARAFFHFYATGITPAMAAAPVGKGSQYAVAFLDGSGDPLHGNKTYKIHLPANVPAKEFWSFTLYDNQTRSMLQTDQQFPGIDNNKPGLKQNADGSYDIYFSPSPPKGWENNWIQTVPGKGWNIVLRLYGPLEPWFDKTWRPGDPVLVE